MALFDQLTPLQLGCLAVAVAALAWLFGDLLWDLARRWRTRRRLARELARTPALLAPRPPLALRADLDGGAADLPALSGGDGRLGPVPPGGDGNGQPARGGERM